MALKQLSKQLETYLNLGYTLCPDKTFLMNAHEILSKIKNEPISISKHVFNELDRLKNAPSNATVTDKMWARDARAGFNVLDDAKASIVKAAPPEVIAKYNLSDRLEDQVIADYLHYRDSENKKVLFLTLDEDAQSIAHVAGLDCVEFNIKKFYKQKERELEVYTADEVASGKKVNAFHRFNRRVYFLYRDIKRIGKIVVYSAIILGVVLYAIANL